VLPYVLAAVTPPVVFYAKLACKTFTVFKHEASQTLSTNCEHFRPYPYELVGVLRLFLPVNYKLSSHSHKQ
jgi:hypothetical protein